MLKAVASGTVLALAVRVDKHGEGSRKESWDSFSSSSILGPINLRKGSCFSRSTGRSWRRCGLVHWVPLRMKSRRASLALCIRRVEAQESNVSPFRLCGREMARRGGRHGADILVTSMAGLSGSDPIGLEVRDRP